MRMRKRRNFFLTKRPTHTSLQWPGAQRSGSDTDTRWCALCRADSVSNRKPARTRDTCGRDRMACAELPPTPGTQLHAQFLHEVHAPKPKAKRRRRGRARGARGGGVFATAGRPTAFSPPGTWSSARGWGQAQRASVFNARGQAPSTLHWAPPAPLVRTESLIAAAEGAQRPA